MSRKKTDDDVRPGAAVATTVADLKPNPHNPRAPWKNDEARLFMESLKKFGDLSGITLNTRSGQLVGGHKRIEAFKSIEPPPEVIRPEGGRPYVLVGGQEFGYREVDWEPSMEAAANLAANKWSADWDWQGVSAILQSIEDKTLIEMIGFPQHDLENLLAADWTPAATESMDTTSADPQPHVVKLTPEQYEILSRAKAAMLKGEDPATTMSDGRAVELACADYLSGAVPTE